jgi:hypothetical protein
VQSAILDSLPILEEIVGLTEREENQAAEKELEKRRMRLGAPPVAQIRRDVDMEVLGTSRVSYIFFGFASPLSVDFFVCLSFPSSMTMFLTIPTRQTISAGLLNPSSSDTRLANSPLFRQIALSRPLSRKKSRSLSTASYCSTFQMNLLGLHTSRAKTPTPSVCI